MNDDSWKDSYDEWKLRSPYDDDYDDDYDPESDCEHEDYDIDVCTGRASCDFCSASWYLSSEEINRELDRQASYQEDMDRENRRQWWSGVLYNVSHPLQAIHWQLQKRGWFRPRVVNDDEIPF